MFIALPLISGAVSVLLLSFIWQYLGPPTHQLAFFIFALIFFGIFAAIFLTTIVVSRTSVRAMLSTRSIEEIAKQPNLLYRMNWESVANARLRDHKLSFVRAGKRASVSVKLERDSQLNEFKSLLSLKLGDKLAFD